MAGRFVFALQPLLEERRRTEARKRQEFALASLARDEGTRELERLEQAVRATGCALHRCVDVQFYDGRLRFLARAITGQHDRLTRSRDDVARVEAELLAAHRERQVVERLRERRMKEFEAAEARRDEMELDEANAQLQQRRSKVPRFGFAQHDMHSASFDSAQDDTGV